MHAILHILGLCNDAQVHPNLLGYLVSLHNNIPYVNLQTIKYYVTKRLRSRRVFIH